MGLILALVELALVVGLLITLAVRATPRRRIARQFRQQRRAIDHTIAAGKRRVDEAVRRYGPSQGWSLGGSDG